MFSPPESCLCHFSTWSKKVSIQSCFPVPKKKKEKKKETHARPITHQPPKPIKSTPTATKPNTSPHSPAAKNPKPNTSPSTTAAEDVDHRRCQSPRRAATTPPCLAATVF